MSIKIKVLVKSDNLLQILHLFNTLYPKRPIQDDYIYWRYLDNPFKSITYIANDLEKIIGSYSGSIFEGFINKKKAKIGFLYDLMIDPNYQNRGLVLPLYSKILEFMQKNKPDFLYAFVNNRSLNLYTKYFKWKLIKKLPLYLNRTKIFKKKLSELNLDIDKITYNPWNYSSKKVINQNILSNLTYKALKEENIFAFVGRTKKMLQWRSKQISGKNFKLFVFKKEDQIIGFCLLKFFNDKVDNKITADLIDIIIYPKKYFLSALYYICLIIENLNVSKIATLGFGQLKKEDLKRLGFENSNISWDLIALNFKSSTKSDFYANMLDTEMF